ncbi:homocysteine S-methyltransferase family protein [Candidatus Nitrosocosmicus agrestis]|uniref:homocysteine S-methyltransferase family protein n=1 Tax=Candidatus Nitrosocosmicus agrestis TaxID=2563600 RepID=UPI001E3C400E|nr:homocysteine S-methyltransferase family protein [Candidatus Nitrosocosmicus sp. SS]
MNSFLTELNDRILLFDGAMGTEIQKYSPTERDYLDNKEGFNDSLNFSRPEWIKQIHQNYIQAGCDCIETNTFGSNTLKLKEFGNQYKTEEFNIQATRIAKEAMKEANKEVYIIGSMGPTGFLPSSNDSDLGNISLNEIEEAYFDQAIGLISGGCDVLLIETGQDVLEMKLAVEGIFRAFKKLEKSLPLISNVTLDQYGKMLLGTNVQSAYTTLSNLGVDLFGLNCSTGPIEMTPSIHWLCEQKEIPILVMPNAGMPINENGQAKYLMSPEEISAKLSDFVSKYEMIRIIGGCCGTSPSHIRKLRYMLDEKEQFVKSHKSFESNL